MSYYEICQRLLIQLTYMGNDDTVTIVSPNKTEVLNREQFIEYIKEYVESQQNLIKQALL